MTNFNNTKSEIFKNAWEMFKTNDHYNFSHALKMAWFDFNNKVEEVATTLHSFTSIVNQIKGTNQDRGSMFAFGESIFNSLEKLATEKGHFASSIIEGARNGKFISDKQACVVAYFAKNNQLIKA